MDDWQTKGGLWTAASTPEANNAHLVRRYNRTRHNGTCWQAYALRLSRKPKPSQRAVVGFDGRCVTVEAFDQVFMAAASGSWPGNAHVSASFVAALAGVPPTDDPVIVRCD